jgi:hypothetical protein
MRISNQVERGAPLTIFVDGKPVPGFSGETVAAVMTAAGLQAFRQDRRGQPRGLYCNMGTCCECMIRFGEDEAAIATRACVLPAADGQRISTGLPMP